MKAFTRASAQTTAAVTAAILIALGTRGEAARASEAQTPSTTVPPTGPQSGLPAPALALPQGEKARQTSPHPEQTQPLTLDQAVALALAANRDLALAVSTLSEAEGNTVSTRANLGPTASLGYTVNRANQAQVTNLGGQSVVIQNQYTSQINGSLSLPLDLSGVLRAATSQAQFQEIASRLDVNRVRNETILTVKNAFYTALRDQALVTVAENDLQNAVDRLADARLRLSAGTVARYDVLSAETTVASAQKTLIQNRTTLSIDLVNLNSAMGIAVDTLLQLTTAGAVEVPDASASLISLPQPSSRQDLTENDLTGQPGQTLGDAGKERANRAQTFVVSDPLPLSTAPSTAQEKYASVLAEALQNRPEILREEASIAAVKKGIVVARSSLLPSTSLGYTYSVNPNASAFSGQKQSGTATLSFTVPLFDAGAARGRVRTARAQIAAAETNRRTQVDTVTREVRQAYLNLQQAQEQIVATRQELAQADEQYRLARLRYTAGVTNQTGVSPLIELSNAQQSLSQAQNNYVNALYDWNSYRSALDKAAGRYAYTGAKPGTPNPSSPSSK
jgi:outer membrane protein